MVAMKALIKTLSRSTQKIIAVKDSKLALKLQH